jgi:hypothetical protein
VSLYLERDTGLDASQQAIEGHVLDRAEVTGLFEQK